MLSTGGSLSLVLAALVASGCASTVNDAAAAAGSGDGGAATTGTAGHHGDGGGVHGDGGGGAGHGLRHLVLLHVDLVQLMRGVRRAAGVRERRVCLTTWRRAPAIRRPFRGQAARAGRPRATTISISSGELHGRGHAALERRRAHGVDRATQRHSSAFDPPALINTLAARRRRQRRRDRRDGRLYRSLELCSRSVPHRLRHRCPIAADSMSSTAFVARFDATVHSASGRAIPYTVAAYGRRKSAWRSLPTARSPS